MEYIYTKLSIILQKGVFIRMLLLRTTKIYILHKGRREKNIIVADISTDQLLCGHIIDLLSNIRSMGHIRKRGQ